MIHKILALWKESGGVGVISVEDGEEKVIEDLKKYQGQYVKLEYKERIKTLPWWGDTHYFIVKVTPEQSPYFNSK